MTAAYPQTSSLIMKLYFASAKALRHCERALRSVPRLVNACFTGFWLGVLDRRMLHAIDDAVYADTQLFHQDQYNRQGLFPWERQAIETYFADVAHIIVGAAGGGREMLALTKLGYEVEGFECNESLVAVAKRLLEEDGATGRVWVAPRDHCPKGLPMYDGAIVGWGAYMLIRGRGQRVSFLRECRSYLPAGAPILLSFVTRPAKSFQFALSATIGNVLGALRGLGKNSEVGDALQPNFVHMFTEQEIRKELEEAGFEVILFSTVAHGHAVGIVDAQSDSPRRAEKEVTGKGMGLLSFPWGVMVAERNDTLV